MGKKRVAIVGSGNWGSAIAKIVGTNCKQDSLFEEDVRMWVHEETIEGRKLTDIINQDHENVKYLPGIKLPENIIADPDIVSVTKDANILVFVLPHQFLDHLCEKIAGNHAPDCIAVSLIKAVHFDENGIVLISNMIKNGLKGMDVSVLMGANIATEVAHGAFCETTIGYRVEANGLLLRTLFDDPVFHVSIINDVPGVEVCGALKNIVALGAGFMDGIGLGDNSKAAIIRIGLMEMRKFIQSHYPGVPDMTFFESCGVADLIVTCYGGRNRKCAEEFVRAGGKKTFQQIEEELLNGQKLQGTPTCHEIYKILQREGALDDYPLFSSIHAIAFEGAPVETILATLKKVEVSRLSAARSRYGHIVTRRSYNIWGPAGGGGGGGGGTVGGFAAAAAGPLAAAAAAAASSRDGLVWWLQRQPWATKMPPWAGKMPPWAAAVPGWVMKPWEFVRRMFRRPAGQQIAAGP